MIHDVAGILKVALVVVLSAVVLGAIAAFYDGQRAGQRAFGLTLSVSVLVGLLQVVDVRFLGWVLGGYGLVLVGGLVWWSSRAR